MLHHYFPDSESFLCTYLALVLLHETMIDATLDLQRSYQPQSLTPTVRIHRRRMLCTIENETSNNEKNSSSRSNNNNNNNFSHAFNEMNKPLLHSKRRINGVRLRVSLSFLSSSSSSSSYFLFCYCRHSMYARVYIVCSKISIRNSVFFSHLQWRKKKKCFLGLLL